MFENIGFWPGILEKNPSLNTCGSLLLNGFLAGVVGLMSTVK